MEEQFHAHLLELEIPIDESDLYVFRGEWAKEHFLQILQAKDETNEGTTKEFPFAANCWVPRIADAYKKTWVQWSDSQREDAIVTIQDGFRAYISELGLTDADASKDPNL